MRVFSLSLLVLVAARPDFVWAVVSVLLFLLLVLLKLFVPDSIVHWDKYRRLEAYRAEIEDYRRLHGRNPAMVFFSEADAGAGFYYEVDGDTYRVCVPVGFDDKICYTSAKSRIRRWPY